MSLIDTISIPTNKTTNNNTNTICCVCLEIKSKGINCSNTNNNNSSSKNKSSHFICQQCFSPYVSSICDESCKLLDFGGQIKCPVPNCESSPWTSHDIRYYHNCIILLLTLLVILSSIVILY